MNAPFKQDARMGRLSTVLGQDVLNLVRFDGAEHVNDVFDYRIEAVALADDLNFEALIGTHATVSLKSFDHDETPFDGIITEARLLGPGPGGWRYGLTLRPWFWLLGQRRKQQIYHQMTVVDILTEVFAPYSGLGEPAVENRLTGDYPTLEYTVQYRESDLDFATRMMERFGISYHFAHAEGSHTLVLTDNISAHDDLPGGSRKFISTASGHRADEEHFWQMRPARRMTTGAIRLTDYNFKTPTAAMEADRTGDAAYAEGQIESYDYPGDYLDQTTGKKVARMRVDQERGQDPRHDAIGDCATLRAGHTVMLMGDKVPGVGKSLCLRVQHSYTAGGYDSGADNSEAAYEGRYLFMPGTAPLRPECKTPRAVVQGPQTATVVGEGEIDCDEYGRILVHFHWDLDKRYSMRCRVSQNWASKGWGGMVIPRIGMEVVVEFLEGDPDKPLVTGCVYNGKNDPPYELPAHKTKSVFRSDTHKGTGFNEFTFEDEKGREKVYLHGQKDHEIHIENDRTKRIDRNQIESVGRNKNIDVGNNHHEVIGGNMTLMVGPNKLQSFVLGKFKALTSTLGDITNKLGLPDAFNMGEGNLVIGVAKNKAETVMVSSSEIVGGAKTLAVGGGYQVSVAGLKNESVLLGSYEEIGQNKVVVAGKRMEFVCGKSKIQLNENGDVFIEGVNVKVVGSSTVDIDGGKVDVN